MSSVLSLLPLALFALLSPSFPPCPVASLSNSLMSSPKPMMMIWCGGVGDLRREQVSLNIRFDAKIWGLQSTH